jgi:protein-tyrosine phosphatase
MAKVVNEGVAPDHGFKFSFPLWSHILPNLWLGGTDDHDTIENPQDEYAERFITKKDFDFVVTLYAWAQPVDWFVREIRYGFYDSKIEDFKDGFDVLYDIASQAHTAWKSGSRVLIRCQAGINRSGLIMAIVLMKEGYSAADAIALMREKRSEYVLMNEEFEDLLLKLDEVGGIDAYIK